MRTATIKKRRLGSIDFQAFEVGLGTWQLGSDWSKVDDKSSQEILAAAVDQGVNFLDTADVYGDGLSEERIGKFLKRCKEEVFVATKFGRFPHPGWPKNFSLYSIQTHIENSLKRLGVEALDLVQAHCLPEDFLKKPELVEWLKILKKQGKIKNYGMSVETVEQAQYCLELEGVSSLQIVFNIFRQNPIAGLLDKAKQKGVAIIVRLPLASGLLSGKFSKGTEFDEEDHRRYNCDGQYFNVGETFSGIPFPKGVDLVEELKALVSPGMTMTQMALRWILDFDGVSVIIPGATSVKQVVENTSASDLPALSEGLHQKIQEFYQKKVVKHIRGKF